MDNQIDTTQDKSLECPVSVTGRSKFKKWMKRVGVAGFLFFLINNYVKTAVPEVYTHLEPLYKRNA